MKDSIIMPQSIIMGREKAELFLNFVLAGKLPKALDYRSLINIWWRNVEISTIDFNVPSMIFELILSMIYRNPSNAKDRFGEVYGKNPNADGFAYKTSNIREIVSELGTFQGIIFEDINKMITSGILNSIDEVDEPVSPLEKIIYY
jgi:hypothetical protein